MTDLSVALEAMRSDANTWATAADRLDAPSAAITGLTLTGADLSRWAVDSGLDRTYEQARTALEDVVAQAGRAFHDLSTTLRAAADTYEREEEANLHALNKIVR
ncbi:type VII secretion target [Saccharothrix sp.]|uniref:type VII secretion target n=1 Tax=Saccharothrix sp. TaxID=1873460 RepID=UPI00281200B0|nr:type VII secretion target [Saccharothrix sp.]